MKYGIYINQKAIIDNGWHSIKANHCAVLEVISNFIVSPKIQKYIDQYGEWYWISNKTVLEAIPMFDIADRRLRQIVTDLAEVGLLDINPNNQQLGRCYLRLGYNYDRYNFDSNSDSGGPMKNISQAYEKYFIGPMKNISKDYNIKDYNINKEVLKSDDFSSKNLHIFEFIENLPEDYYETHYKHLGDCRAGVFNFISDNLHRFEKYNTWIYYLDTKINLASKNNERLKVDIDKIPKEILAILNRFTSKMFMFMQDF